ncbi:hypothetical protein BT96DRAFT_945293 [Gymnopus androsaceus JB14]|uniref:Uncharacterized protein n=1 Tax=Gymnopus androsaceus JB14 TaxID=1447944 RepID=A0A6A4H1G7_9AGAR|nr:hypothetical protein BT96DRAFT_945293 [Gymnopus androsaceus JB14]
MAELGAWRKLSGLTEWMKVDKQLRVGGNTSELPLAPVDMESLGFDLYSIDMVLQSINSGLFSPFSRHPKLFHMLGHERKVQIELPYEKRDGIDGPVTRASPRKTW